MSIKGKCSIVGLGVAAMGKVYGCSATDFAAEAVVQARGQGGERQAEKNDLILVSGNGGVLNYHSTTILGKRPA